MIAVEKPDAGVLAGDLEKTDFPPSTPGASSDFHGNRPRASQRPRLLWWSLVLKVMANQERPVVYRTGSRVGLRRDAENDSQPVRSLVGGSGVMCRMSVSSVLETVQMWPQSSQRQYQTSLSALVPSRRLGVSAPQAGQSWSVIVVGWEGWCLHLTTAEDAKSVSDQTVGAADLATGFNAVAQTGRQSPRTQSSAPGLMTGGACLRCGTLLMAQDARRHRHVIHLLCGCHLLHRAVTRLTRRAFG